MIHQCFSLEKAYFYDVILILFFKMSFLNCILADDISFDNCQFSWILCLLTRDKLHANFLK